MPILTPFGIDGFSVNGTNFLSWESKDPQTAIMWDVFRKVGGGAYSLIGTVNPVPTTRGVNLGLSMAETMYEDASAVKGTNYIYRVQGRLSGSDVSAFTSEVVVDSRGTEYFIGPGGSDSANGTSQATRVATLGRARQLMGTGGANVLVFTGTMTFSSIEDMPDGFSMRGLAPGTVINCNLPYNNQWWDDARAQFRWENGGAMNNANVLVKDLSFVTPEGLSACWSPLYFRNKRGIVLRNVQGINFFRSVFNLQSAASNIWLRNCTFTDSGQEEGSFSTGGITSKGDTTNMWVQDTTLDHRKKGYAAKIQYSYEKEENFATGIHYQRVVCRGKVGSKFSTTYNISTEHWRMKNRGNEVSDCFFDTHPSFDTDNRFLDGYAYSTYFHNNTFRIIGEQSGEMAGSYIWGEDNWIDIRANTNAWAVFGEFNSGVPLVGQRWRRNLLDCGTRQTSWFVFTCNVQDFEFEQNYIRQETSDGPVVLLEFRRANSNGAKTGYKVRNNVFDTLRAPRMFMKVEGADGGIATGMDFRGNAYRQVPTDLGLTPDSTNDVLVPAIVGTGDRATTIGTTQFFTPTSGGNLIDAGVNIGLPFAGPAPDAGLIELGTSVQPPSLAVTTPPPATLVLGASFPINYTVTATNGTVTQVQLLQDNVPVQTDSTAPFNTFAVSGLAAGTYVFKLRGTDSNGRVGESQNYTVVVRAANVPPTVSLNALNSQYPAGGTVLLEATTADTDGTVTKVEFFAGATKLGEKTSAPWIFNWQPAVGTYSLTARATDNDGAPTTSAARSITVAPLAAGPFLAYNIGGINADAGAVTVGGRTFTAHLESGVKSGVAWENPGPGNPNFSPVTNAETETLLRSYVAQPLIERPVPNARYNVFVWAFEDNVPAPFDLLVQGVLVLDDYLLRGTGAAGAWERLGPFTADVLDGILSIKSPTRSMNMSAYEVDVVGGAVSLNLTASAGSVASGQPVTLTAAPVLPAGVSVQKIEFFAGTVKLGEDVSAPYSFIWTPAAGTYSLTARLTDNAGLVYISNAVAVTAAPANLPPTGTLTGPGTAFSRTTATFNVNISDDGGVSLMRLMRREGQTEVVIAERTLAGNPATGTQTIAWTDLPPGQWNVFVRLTDAGGLVGETNTLTLTVTQDVRQGENWGYILQADGSRLFVISRQQV